MDDENVIPANYEQWRNCIEVSCRIPLTPQFISKRLAELQDKSHTKTKEFVRCYGDAHLQRTIEWFRQAAATQSGQ